MTVTMISPRAFRPEDAPVSRLRRKPFSNFLVSLGIPHDELLPLQELHTVRQTTGLTLRAEKNPAERELDRLGFRRGEIRPSTGERKADRLVDQFMGPIVEQALSQFVQSPRYLEQKDEVRGELLRLALAEIRGAAIERAKATDPRLFAKLKVQGLPRRRRKAIEAVTGKTLKQLLEEATGGDPFVDLVPGR